VKILVTGDRNWDDWETLSTVLDGYHPTLIIEGCARGADRMAEIWARKRQVPNKHFPANWDLYGRSAGPRRNQEMLTTKPDLVVAFHSNIENSRGTAHMIRIAEAKGIDVSLFKGSK
jgi:YspA, cpYpsA-related SLOG family